MDAAPADRVQVIGAEDWGPNLDLVEGNGRFVEIVGPSCGASERSLHRVELHNGAMTRPLRHSGEAVYYLHLGAAIALDVDLDEEYVLREGAMVHVDPGTTYRFFALDYAVLLGGPCPTDATMYPAVGDIAAPISATEENV